VLARTIGDMDGSGIWLPWEGREVTRVCIDHAFSIELWRLVDGEASVRLEAPFVIETNGNEQRYDPEGPRELLAYALTVFGRTVERAVCFDSGGLELVFSDGLMLHQMGSDDGYEAWSAVGPGNCRIVSGGNRSLATWGAELRRFGALP